MRYFDLHCDTATELFDDGSSLERSARHISLDTISGFESYSQVFAVFSKEGASDEDCYGRFFDVVKHFRAENGVTFRTSADSLSERENNYILSVEDARLLAGDLSRLGVLYDCGVRVLTPLWAGVTCIGGSFDTDEGLTRFGKDVVEECCRLGITVDISHASERSADEAAYITGSHSAPIIASHSDSYSVNSHPRNLRDRHAKTIKQSGGVIGICLHAPHVANAGADAEAVFAHVDRLISLTDEDTVCIGADFDGTDNLPHGFSSQADIYKTAEVMLRHNYTDRTVDKVLFANAYAYFKKYLGKA